MPISNTKIVAYTNRKKADDVFYIHVLVASKKAQIRLYLPNNTINIE